MSEAALVAIDQGTSSSRAMAFSTRGELLGVEQQNFESLYPASGWVEQDPEVLWATVLSTVRSLLGRLQAAGHRVVALGLTNQRETTVVWNKRTGAPVYNAIVWQDRRTAQRCRELSLAGHESIVAEKTGLRLDPYFSATKLAWILDAISGARRAAQAGELAFGTIDSFLIWRLTGGRLHVTDASNASRTALYDIASDRWMKRCAICLAYRSSVCRRFATVLETSAQPILRCSGYHCPFGVSRAISRRHSSVRLVWPSEMLRVRMARVRSWSPIPANGCCAPPVSC